MESSNQFDKVDFKINLSVRISDINYGGHLGHAELIKITHQARLKFLSAYALKESNLNRAGIIVKHLIVDYKGEAFFEDLLTISIKISEITKTSCTFFYKIDKDINKPVATVQELVLFMNYEKRRLVRVPQVIIELKEKSIFNEQENAYTIS